MHTLWKWSRGVPMDMDMGQSYLDLLDVLKALLPLLQFGLALHRFPGSLRRTLPDQLGTGSSVSQVCRSLLQGSNLCPITMSSGVSSCGNWNITTSFAAVCKHLSICKLASLLMVGKQRSALRKAIMRSRRSRSSDRLFVPCAEFTGSPTHP